MQVRLSGSACPPIGADCLPIRAIPSDNRGAARPGPTGRFGRTRERRVGALRTARGREEPLAPPPPTRQAFAALRQVRLSTEPPAAVCRRWQSRRKGAHTPSPPSRTWAFLHPNLSYRSRKALRDGSAASRPPERDARAAHETVCPKGRAPLVEVVLVRLPRPRFVHPVPRSAASARLRTTWGGP